MTPADLAKQIVDEILDAMEKGNRYYREEWYEKVEAKVNIAILAERERCAKVAENWRWTSVSGSTVIGLKGIAVAILEEPTT